ncbi:hypothetical protein BLOT_000242 [Blomia tropicalis]|nr:hypothetical protein BLOT_000242 [Blomia tropicalis]
MENFMYVHTLKNKNGPQRGTNHENDEEKRRSFLCFYGIDQNGLLQLVVAIDSEMNLIPKPLIHKTECINELLNLPIKMTFSE